MRNLFFIFFIISFPSFSQGTWLQRSPLPTAGRGTAVAFSIGSKGYVGTGMDALGTNLDDFWEYDPVSDTWTQKANFGGGLRSFAVGFSIGNKGYVGTGRNGAVFRDFWEYDPLTNLWTQKANFGGTARLAACGFSAGGFGVIGMGSDGLGVTQDVWKYNPATNTWSVVGNFPGGLRTEMDRASFSLGGKGYWGTGWASPTSPQNDFWELDPATN